MAFIPASKASTRGPYRLLGNEVLNIAEDTNVVECACQLTDSRLHHRDAGGRVVGLGGNLVDLGRRANFKLGCVTVNVSELLDQPKAEVLDCAADPRLGVHWRCARR